jgi:EmrB/QacA subfamily drug resistance transporter
MFGGRMGSLKAQSETATPLLPLNRDSASRRWLALAVLLTGAFLPILDFTIVNLALPSIRRSLRASSSEVQFVISAYAATYAVMLITGGRLGDLFGRKRMFVTGVAGFTIASTICGLAGSATMLILGRVLQALMATVMAPQVLASIRVLFPGHEQARALGLYGATFGLANICGQLLGGLLVSAHPFGLAWQGIFFVNLPIGIIAFVGGIVCLEENRSPHAKNLDIRGVIYLSITLGCLVYPLIEGRESGWPSWMTGMFLVSVVAFICFVRHESRLSENGLDPLVELSLFRSSRFTLGIVMGLVFYMLSAFYLTFSIYLQGGLRKSPVQAGFVMLPFAVSFFLGSMASSVVMSRLKTYALSVGFALQVVGFGIVALCARHQVAGFEEGLACAGIGYGLVMPGVIKAVIGHIDERHAGLASGIVMTTLQIGAALGVAIVGGVFYTILGDQTDMQAYARAFSDSMALNVALLGLGCVLSLFLPNESSVASL